MLIGSDIDGVLSTGWRPSESEYVIVSGRTLDEWGRTIKELGVEHPIFLRPYGVPCDRQAAGEWKSLIVSKMGITKFYEDDEVQASIIRENNPGCEVVIIGVGCV